MSLNYSGLLLLICIYTHQIHTLESSSFPRRSIRSFEVEDELNILGTFYDDIPGAIKLWFQTQIMNRFAKNVIEPYKQKAADIGNSFKEIKIYDAYQIMIKNEEFGRLTRTVLVVIGKIEAILQEYDLFLSKIEYSIRDKYTSFRNNRFAAASNTSIITGLVDD